MKEYGGLGDLCGFKVLGRAVEHDVGYLEPENLVGSVQKVFTLGAALVEILRHPGELGPLTGEYVRFSHI